MAKMDFNTIKQTIQEKINIEDLKAKALEKGVQIISHPTVQKALGHPLATKTVEVLLSTRDKFIKTYEIWSGKNTEQSDNIQESETKSTDEQ